MCNEVLEDERNDLKNEIVFLKKFNVELKGKVEVLDCDKKKLQNEFNVI